MANIKQTEEEVVALIDTSKVLIDKVLTIMEIFVSSPSVSLTFSTNPIKYLLNLLEHLKITRDEIELWLTKFLIFEIPILEVSVKAILLTNLKNMISCSIDPRIPERYRKQHTQINNYESAQKYGIDINIESIDFMDKLSINPLNEIGNNWYFGLNNVDDSYKFARADDMDAFLWFVIHKGKFPNSSTISTLNDIGSIHGSTTSKVTPTDGSLLSTVNVTYDKDESSSILLGNTFRYDGNAHMISMCIDRKLGESGNTISNTLVPVSDDWSSVNWYTKSSDYFTKNLGLYWNVKKGTKEYGYLKKSRDFNKEKGICNIQYINQAESSNTPLTGLVNNKFRFTILPKPYVHIPLLEQGEAPWQFTKMLFNDKGYYDKNGKYTFAEGSVSDEDLEGDNVVFRLNGVNVKLNTKSRQVVVGENNEKSSRDILVKNLMECYPGLTVYEFNYDYIMGMRLFDAKVLAHSLMESVVNMNMGLSADIKPKHQEGTETIKEIIKNILESDDSEVSNCYYTFDNTKYDSLLRKAEEKRARQQRFGNVTHETGLFNNVNEILNEYDSTTEEHVQIDILRRAITQASVTVSQGVDEKDKYDVEFNFIIDLIENLLTTIINSILSPKVLMLLEVNQTLMGGTWEKFTMKDLLKSLENIIISIVKEIRDLIIQELKGLVTKYLNELLEAITPILVREQLEYYSEAIMDMIRNCPDIWFRFGNKLQDTTLDNVDYADIDTNSLNKGEQPNIDNC